MLAHAYMTAGHKVLVLPQGFEDLDQGALLEEKVDEFMQNDEDGDNTITFTEFLHMDQRNDTQKSKKGHFKYSRGLVETTLEEDRRLLAQVNAMLAAKDEPKEKEKYGAVSMREIMGGS